MLITRTLLLTYREQKTERASVGFFSVFERVRLLLLDIDCGLDGQLVFTILRVEFRNKINLEKDLLFG